MKICQLCAVDFTLYHFLLPLMRAQRDAGHEVVGVCARGKLAEKVEAEGFRVIDAPIKRSQNPVALFRAYGALRDLFAAERFDAAAFESECESRRASLRRPSRA